MRLVRVRDGYLAGVAGGVARSLGTEASFVRLVFLASILCGGLGVAIYLVLWALAPRDDRVPLEPPHGARFTRASVDRKIAGVLGGIAYHYDKDPTLVRLLGVLLIPCSAGLFIVAYVGAVILVPVAGRATIPASTGI